MKSSLYIPTLVIGLIVGLTPGSVLAFNVVIADSTWDGKNPDGEQCQRFGGQGKTPPLLVKGIPTDADEGKKKFKVLDKATVMGRY